MRTTTTSPRALRRPIAADIAPPVTSNADGAATPEAIEQSAAVPVDPSKPSHEDVSARAYLLYLERGCEDGHDVEDWLRAEQELAEEFAPVHRLSAAS